MAPRLEHANLVVEDLEGMIRFLQTAFPSFVIRWEWTMANGVRCVHIGTEDDYLAVSQATAGFRRKKVLSADKPGLLHLGYEVDDVEVLRERLKSAGYTERLVADRHPHRKRVYFGDGQGNEWEFVQYFSDDPAERNDYELDD